MIRSLNNVLFKIIIVFSLVLLFTFAFHTIINSDKKQFYNMNVSESIKLSSIYDKENVNWEVSNDKVLISYDAVIAKKVGKSVISALNNDGDKLFEATINVLGDDDLSVDTHKVNLKLKQNKKIVVNDTVMNNNDSDDNSLEFNNSISNDNNLDETVVYDNELSDSVSYDYNSSDEEVVVVDDDGNLEPVSSGDAVVTVNDNNGNKDYVYVTVEDDDIDLYSLEYDLNVGDVLDIDYSLNSIVYDVSDISWSSDNVSVATVDSNGSVSAINSGSTYIKVKVGDSIEKKVLVNVLENTTLPEDLELSTYNVDVKIGDFYVINGIVYPYSANNRDISWYSSNDSIITVNNGIVKAVGVGSAIVTATTGNGIKKEVYVNVKNKYIDVESIDILEHSVDVKVGDKKKIDYNILPEDASDKTVKYVYDKNYLNVDKDGNVETIKPGVTVLSIVTYNGMQDEVLLNIVEEDVSTTEDIEQQDIDDEVLPMSIELEKKDIELKLEDIYKINAKVINGSEDEKLLLASNNENVVEILDDGSIKAVGVGNAIITVSIDGANDVKANCFVRVKNKDVAVNSVGINYKSIDLFVGDNKILISSVYPNNSTNKNIKWTSSNVNVVTVDNGNVKAVGAGSAIVRAISDYNNNIYAECIVNVKSKIISVNKISINKKSLKLVEGNSSNVKVSVYPSNATNKGLKWVSSNEKVVNVSNGNVKAVGAGSAVVKAISLSNPNIVAECNVKVIKKVTNKDKFIKSLDNMSKQVQKDRKNGRSWTYAGTRRGTFKNARKNGRTIDCALYVSYALVDVGILDSNSRFFKREANKIAYDGSAKSKMKKHLTYISGNGKKASTLIKEGKLQKGDIVLWYNRQHTNVYAGNKKWYDGGRWKATGASSSAGGKFKTLGPVAIGDLNSSWKVWKILRVKD